MGKSISVCLILRGLSQEVCKEKMQKVATDHISHIMIYKPKAHYIDFQRSNTKVLRKIYSERDVPSPSRNWMFVELGH